MWTPAAREKLAREHRPYATCLTNTKWALVAPLLTMPAASDRPWRWPLRRVFDGILYVLRSGCVWRHRPRDFPPWSTMHRWFLRLSPAGVFERRAHALTLADRERAGREASPTGGILDAQAARSGGTGMAGARGYDPARGVVGRKRHALTDTDGRLLRAAVSLANPHDSHGAIALLRTARGLGPFLSHAFADQAYRGKRVGKTTAVRVEIVKPMEKQKSFAVRPRR